MSWTKTMKMSGALDGDIEVTNNFIIDFLLTEHDMTQVITIRARRDYISHVVKSFKETL